MLLHSSVLSIQRAYRAMVFRNRLRGAFERLARTKMIVRDTVLAWRTRRALNCLGNEV